jgi:hypothetical protein
MAHIITLTDEQYDRLQAAAGRSHKAAEDLLAEWLESLAAAGSSRSLSDEEYRQRWAAFWPLVGSIPHGQPLSSDDIDELIGEEAADAHADAAS